jgi:ATPase inhibitor subunit zeta
MTTLDQREDAFEAEFAHQEELKFRVRERAVRNLAIWAAGRLKQATPWMRMPVTSSRRTLRARQSTQRSSASRKCWLQKGIGENEIRHMMERFMSAADLAVRSPSGRRLEQGTSG